MRLNSKKDELHPQSYVVLTLDEFVRLLICIILDVLEFAFPLMLSPIYGDILDFIGIVAGFMMFGWIGVLASLELIPGADLLPIFVFTWILWYYLKKRQERAEREKWLKETGI